MDRPLKLLLLGRDPDMFAGASRSPSDTRERHIAYVRELQRRRPGSEVRAIVHTRRPEGGRFDRPFAGLEIYGTHSAHRLECPLTMARLVRRFRNEGWIADLISCQSGYEEGPIALALADRASRIEIQLHSDFYGEAFVAGGPLRAIQQQVLRAAIRRSDHARAVSVGIRDSIVRSGDMPAERITVAPVPVTFVAADHEPAPIEPTVLFVGRLAPEKDLGLWLAVARLIRARKPETRFVLAGDGPEATRVADGAKEFGAALRQLGAVPYAELPELYAGASVFLLTSAFEGLGRVVVEAMLAGLPVVSTATLGPLELISDGETGRIVRSRDAGAIADAVVALLESPDRAAAMGRSARRWAQDNFGFEAACSRLVDGWEHAAQLSRRLR